MIREIAKGEEIFAEKALPATLADLAVAQDLLETLRAHGDECVGMAANMIGVNRAIIAFLDGTDYRVMLNPRILRRYSPYETEEGCLSLLGKRPTTRYRTVKVAYDNEKGKACVATFTDFTAQIIQHEVDHLQGVVI